MYSLIRQSLFAFQPETAHAITLKSLNYLSKTPFISLIKPETINCKTEVMGITFPNPVGLAAGLDKNAECIEGLSALGFGFIEVGTVTPKAQAGNPKPRLFRIPQHQAIINRLGFNNQGVDTLIKNVSNSKYHGILGINIGKNKDTPESEAVNDYLICLRKVYTYANYITINISSPNTPGLRDLQKTEALKSLLKPIMEEQKRLSDQHNKRVPIAVKIAPDLSDDEIQNIAKTLISLKVDGVIVSNTTISRPQIEDLPIAIETGGLSGKPLNTLSTQTLRKMHSCLQGEIPIIGVGGILSGSDAQEKIKAGASLVQMYTGFIYKGPQLITDAITSIKDNRI